MHDFGAVLEVWRLNKGLTLSIHHEDLTTAHEEQYEVIIVLGGKLDRMDSVALLLGRHLLGELDALGLLAAVAVPEYDQVVERGFDHLIGVSLLHSFLVFGAFKVG